ncbi:uncharacterized protein LOC125166779 isoform X2 [Prionailurus viverrinus]|uniref:uncharacterized protein LOC125166779 isoform X2 n=1 Tax=Prionailurus viverrinus TaxID=61388 RepID=UPI001FF1792E|nr:uncharacterized protein LOC125166779 isoform X2 [Prionailurus viverrinus]
MLPCPPRSQPRSDGSVSAREVAAGSAGGFPRAGEDDFRLKVRPLPPQRRGRCGDGTARPSRVGRLHPGPGEPGFSPRPGSGRLPRLRAFEETRRASSRGRDGPSPRRFYPNRGRASPDTGAVCGTCKPLKAPTGFLLHPLRFPSEFCGVRTFSGTFSFFLPRSLLPATEAQTLCGPPGTERSVTSTADPRQQERHAAPSCRKRVTRPLHLCVGHLDSRMLSREIARVEPRLQKKIVEMRDLARAPQFCQAKPDSGRLFLAGLAARFLALIQSANFKPVTLFLDCTRRAETYIFMSRGSPVFRPQD